MSVSWHEAVSIVLETAAVCTEAEPRGAMRPRVDAVSCALTRGGDVMLEDSTTSTDTSDAVMLFFRELLVDPNTPVEVDTLSNTSTLDTLSDDLMRFASPPKRRRADLASVALRGLAAEAELARRTVDAIDGVPREDDPPPAPDVQDDAVPPDNHEAEYGRLRTLVGNGVLGAGPGLAVRWLKSLKSLDRRLVAAVGGPLVLALLVGLWSAWSSRSALPVLEAVALNTGWSLPVASLAETPTGNVRNVRPRPAVAKVPATDPLLFAAVELSTLPRSLPESVPRDALPPIAMPAPEAAAPPSLARPSSQTPSPAPVVAAAANPRAALTTETAVDATVYSWTNRDVVPPVLRYPNQPRSVLPPSAATTDGPYIELLIDSAGRVETVRLRGRVEPGDTSYRHSMMLSAAKTWQFTPAKRDGHPVRYVARVVMEP